MRQSSKPCSSPQQFHVEGEVTRQREKCGQGSFFNGKASAIIRIPNESAETDLRQWSFNAVKTLPLKWPDLPFNAHVPSIHSCSLSKDEKKPYIGHDDSWCRIRRQQPPEVNRRHLIWPQAILLMGLRPLRAEWMRRTGM